MLDSIVHSCGDVFSPTCEDADVDDDDDDSDGDSGSNDDSTPSAAAAAAAAVHGAAADGAAAAAVHGAAADGAPFVPLLVLSNPVAYGAAHVCEARGIPLHLLFPQPWVPTRAFAHSMSILGTTTTTSALASTDITSANTGSGSVTYNSIGAGANATYTTGAAGTGAGSMQYIGGNEEQDRLSPAAGSWSLRNKLSYHGVSLNDAC